MINEKMGVPDNIELVAKRIHRRILTYLNRKNIDIFFGENLLLYTVFRIGNLDLNISVKINLDKIDQPLTQVHSMSMAMGAEFEMSGEKLRKRSIMDDPSLVINIVCDRIDIEKIRNELSDVAVVSHIAHELKHLYDNYYRNPSVIGYSKYQSFQFNIGLPSVAEFLFLLYYTTVEENLVRPVEFYTDMVENNITKKDFRDYIKSSEIIKWLSKGETMTLDMLKETIKSDPMLKYFLEQLYASEDYESVGDPVDDVLNIVLINIINNDIKSLDRQIDGYKRRLVRENPVLRSGNVINIIMNQPLVVDPSNEEKLRKIFVDRLNKFQKYENNREKYFENLIKDLNFTSMKMKRKLYKLYDMLPEETKNESILNWELFNKINSKPIVTKIDWEKLKK